MPRPLLVVDVQNGFINEYTRHIPARIAKLIKSGEFEPIIFTRFINAEGSSYRKFLDWHECGESPEVDLADDMRPFAKPELVFSKSGYAGISDELSAYLREQSFEEIAIAGIDTDMCVLKVAMDAFDHGIKPIVFADCCASTAGLQSHFAGLAVLARNIGANQLMDAGLISGPLGAP